MKLGFGTWQIGGECTFGGRQTGWGKTDLNEAKSAIQYALDAGVDFFDTAPGYGKGQSETVLGQVFANNKSHNIKVCTKFGSYENPSGESFLDFSKQSLIKSVEDSLTRLQIEQIDTLLLHSPADDFNYDEYDISGFEQLIDQGKIKNYGVSVKSLKGAINVVNVGFGNVIESIYNLLDRRVEDLVFTHDNFKTYQFIGRVPLASGFLTSKYLENLDMQFDKSDIRSNINNNDRGWYKNSVNSLSFLNDLEGGISVSALRYVMFNSKTAYVIPGMRTVSQVQNNLLAVSLGPLSDDLIKQIKSAMPSTNPNWIF